ncbi:hypothetical protein [Flavobacterium suzhouense]|uniref:Uncharacterized protein n=1 Tax=Flavobacterium suzhouense TaxID=1529638 RepID=A0ABW5NUD1_9FLAO
MKRLSKFQIQFIDDRLYNLGVKYIDIRYEMVDHIASELETMEGDFGENWTEYFISHHNDILKQNRRAKWTAVLRAVKLYFRTMAMPVVLLSAVSASVLTYYASFLVDERELNSMGFYVLIPLILPIMWFGRKNKELSVMSPMVVMFSVIFNLYQVGGIISYSAENDAMMFFIRRISIAMVPAFTLVLIISLYLCRKQYVGKYI